MVSSKSSVTLFVGTEAYLKEKAIKDLAASILGKSSGGSLDFKVFYGGGTDARDVLDYIATFPFSSAKRLVIIKDFYGFSQEDRTRLLQYLKKPSPRPAHVAFDLESDSILKEDPSLSRSFTVVKVAGPDDEGLYSWIKARASSLGKDIERGAVEILKELKGPDLLSLAGEIEKLAAFVGERRDIKAEDAEQAVGKSVIGSIYGLGAFICEKNAERAIELVSELIASGKKTQEIVGLLSWHFKRLVRGLVLKSHGETNFSISTILGINRKYANEFFRQMRSVDMRGIRSKMDILLEADLDIKSSRLEPALALELGVMRLCLS